MIFTKKKDNYAHNALFDDIKVRLPRALDKKYTQIFQRAKALNLGLEHDDSLKNDSKLIEQDFEHYKPSIWKDIAAIFPWTKEYKLRKVPTVILNRINETIQDMEKTKKEIERQEAEVQAEIPKTVVKDYFAPIKNSPPPMKNYYYEKVKAFNQNAGIMPKNISETLKDIEQSIEKIQGSNSFSFWQNYNKTIEPTADENVNHNNKFGIS